MIRRYSLIAVLTVFTVGMVLGLNKPAAAAFNEVLYPTEGQVLTGGSTVEIRYTVSEYDTFDDLYFSGDNKSTWQSVNANWNVPNINSDHCYIKLDVWGKNMIGNDAQYSYYSGEFKIRPAIGIIDPIIQPVFVFIAAPANLQVDSTGSDFVQLSWDDKTNFEDGFKLERKTGDGAYAVIKSLPANTESYTYNTVNAGTTYSYRVRAFDGSNYSAYSNVVSATMSENPGPVGPTDPAPVEPGPGAIEMIFYLGSTEYYVNGQLKTMDAAPIALEGRTVLPIRYVADALGAQVAWDALNNRVTVSGTKTIELTIGNPWARVNGALTFIDPNNERVIPVVLPPGRTMLPLRFTAETLGCSVQWNPAVQEVKLHYPAS